MIAVALLFFTPAIVWNIQHEWPTADWLWQRGGLNNGLSIHLPDLLIFLGSQAAVLSPLFFVGLLYVLCQPSTVQITNPPTLYAAVLFLPLFGLYFVLSVHYLEPANWTAAAYIGGLLLLAAKWTELAAVHPWAKRAAFAALFLAAAETASLLETRWLHLPAKVDPLDRARGSRSLAAAVAQAQQQTGAQFVIADSYMTAALLSFYLPGQPETFLPITTRPLNQMEVWPSYDQVHPSGNALILAKRAYPAKSLSGSFGRISRLGDLQSSENGRNIARFHLFLGERAKNSNP